jgi:hypothetical protein
MSILQVLTSLLSDRIETATKTALAPLAPYLRRIALGVTLVILSSVAFIFTMLFIATGLFLSLSNYAALSEAALWTALPCGVVGAISLFWGLSIIRPPR